jgi:excinuclease ABC subunit C
MENLKNTLSHLPHSPGVYIYRNAEGIILYIGKAKDLSRRVKQYFQRDDAVGAKTALLVSQIVTLEYIKTVSEFDALLLEAKLIYEHQPKYNVLAKDDKSPLYIRITDAPIPVVTFTRKSKIDEVSEAHWDFGPFQSSRVARSLLRQLRHVIPYCTQKIKTDRPCFYAHIGLCNPCPSYIWGLPDGDQKTALTKQYRAQILRLRDILSGKALGVLDDMEKQMNEFAKSERFEEATVIRNHMKALYDLLNKKYDASLYIQSDTQLEDITTAEISQLVIALQPWYPNVVHLHRIECVDISNLQGTDATGSVVVLTDGIVDRSQYRKFKIRSKNTPDDFAMIAEVLIRRFRHKEWKFPDLLVIDGGKGQVQSAHTTLNTLSLQIPIIGLAKRREEIIVKKSDSEFVVMRLPLTSAGLHLLERIRDEAHRFAITYHRKLRAKQNFY